MTAKQTRLHADRSPVSLHGVARRTLKKHLRQVLHFLPLAAKHFRRDPEYVHQLRVATRRAGAALQIFRGLLPSKRAKRIQRQLRRIRKACGRARDLDVLAERLDRENKLLRREIARRRKRSQVPLLKVYQKLRRSQFKKEAKGLVRRVRWRGTGPEPELHQAALDSLGELARNFFRIAEADLSLNKSLHRLRIRGKRLRYGLELLSDAFVADAFESDQLAAPRQAITQIQKQLGVVNDHAVAVKHFHQWISETTGISETSDPSLAESMRSLCDQEQLQGHQAAMAFRKEWAPSHITELKELFAKQGIPIDNFDEPAAATA